MDIERRTKKRNVRIYMEHTATTEVAIKLAKVAKLLRDYHGNNPLKELKEAFSLLDDPDVIRYIKLITTPQSAS